MDQYTPWLTSVFPTMAAIVPRVIVFWDIVIANADDTSKAADNTALKWSCIPKDGSNYWVNMKAFSIFISGSFQGVTMCSSHQLDTSSWASKKNVPFRKEQCLFGFQCQSSRNASCTMCTSAIILEFMHGGVKAISFIQMADLRFYGKEEVFVSLCCSRLSEVSLIENSSLHGLGLNYKRMMSILDLFRFPAWWRECGRMHMHARDMSLQLYFTELVLSGTNLHCRIEASERLDITGDRYNITRFCSLYCDRNIESMRRAFLAIPQQAVENLQVN